MDNGFPNTENPSLNLSGMQVLDADLITLAADFAVFFMQISPISVTLATAEKIHSAVHFVRTELFPEI